MFWFLNSVCVCVRVVLFVQITRELRSKDLKACWIAYQDPHNLFAIMPNTKWSMLLIILLGRKRKKRKCLPRLLRFRGGISIFWQLCMLYWKMKLTCKFSPLFLGVFFICSLSLCGGFFFKQTKVYFTAESCAEANCAARDDFARESWHTNELFLQGREEKQN